MTTLKKQVIVLFTEEEVKQIKSGIYENAEIKIIVGDIEDIEKGETIDYKIELNF